MSTLKEQIQSEIENEEKLSGRYSSEKPTEEKPPLADVTAPQPVSGMTQVKSKPLEYMEPATEWRGMTGAVTRGLSVPAAQALAGAILGSPGGPAGMAIGAGAAPLVFGLTDIATEGFNYLSGKKLPTTSEFINEALTKANLPEPDTATERITQAVTEGIAGGGTSAFLKSGAKKLATEAPKILAKFFPAATPKIAKAAEFMGEKPVLQALTGGVSAAASSGAQEAGAGPVVSILAGLAGAGSVPALKYGAKALQRTFFPTAHQIQQEAVQAAKGIYHLLLPDEVSKQKTQAKLQRAGELADKDVNLMTGEITGQTGLLALQQALEKSSIEVANRKVENIEGISTKIKEGLEPSAVKPEETANFLQNETNKLHQQYIQSRQNLISKSIEPTREFENADIALQQAEKDLAENKITAEQAYNKTKQIISEAVDSEKLRQSYADRGKVNQTAASAIQIQRKANSDYATSLYNEVQGVEPFTPETAIKTIEDLVPSGAVSKSERVQGKTTSELISKQVEENPNIPTAIKTIYKNLIDKNGNKIPKDLKDVMSGLRELNASISTERNEAQRRIMLLVKESINEDLKKLEKTYPQIAKANEFYSEYYDTFKSKAAKEAFEKDGSLTQVLDKYSGSEDDLIRLRKSIEGRSDVPVTKEHLKDTGFTDLNELKQKGFKAVDDWILSKVEDVLKKPTSKEYTTSQSIEKWKNKEGSVIFKAFNESASKAEEQVNELLNQFKALEEDAISAKTKYDNIAKQKITEGHPAKDAYNKARLEKQQIDEYVKVREKQIKTEFNEKTNSSLNPANKFIGGNAEDIFGKILGSDTSRVDMAKVIEAASKDPTGKALEGLKNAARKHLKSKVQLTSEPTVEAGITDVANFNDKLRVSLGESNELLRPGSPKRDVLEMLFGKNSRELNSLDKTREFLNMMSQKTDFSASDIAKYKDIAQNSNINDLLSLGAIAFGNVKGWVAWKSLDLIRKLQKNTRKDMSKIFQDILIKAQFDPETAMILSEPITPENFKLTQRLLRNFGIQAKATDFGIEEPKQNEQETTQSKGGEFPKL